jgi:hypothetical protein
MEKLHVGAIALAGIGLVIGVMSWTVRAPG